MADLRHEMAEMIAKHGPVVTTDPNWTYRLGGPGSEEVTTTAYTFADGTVWTPVMV